MKVLSIDAWGNKKDGYEWNNWFNVGTIEKQDFQALRTDKQIAKWKTVIEQAKVQAQ